MDPLSYYAIITEMWTFSILFLHAGFLRLDIVTTLPLGLTSGQEHDSLVAQWPE